MSREKESNDYDELKKAFELWTEELAARGPRAIAVIQREMHDYLGRKIDEELWAPEPCIDFDHQKNYN
jgi:hypothetical protein